jgi:hypothetical protein
VGLRLRVRREKNEGFLTTFGMTAPAATRPQGPAKTTGALGYKARRNCAPPCRRYVNDEKQIPRAAAQRRLRQQATL